MGCGASIPNSEACKNSEALPPGSEAPEAVFKDLWGFADGGCEIPETAVRGICLKQLYAVFAHIRRRCVVEQWVDYEEKPIVPERSSIITPGEKEIAISLYETTKYVVKPATQARGKWRARSLVEVLSIAKQKPKWLVSHWWGKFRCVCAVSDLNIS